MNKPFNPKHLGEDVERALGLAPQTRPVSAGTDRLNQEIQRVMRQP